MFGCVILLGCAVAPPNNKPVEIADESAIIVWDAGSSTQHFIRRATFKSAAQDFGFMVPTPTKPELAESDDAAFKELARITAPKVVKQPRPSPGVGCIGCSSSEKRTAVGAAPDAVQVLDEKRVAGYDAVVLQADNADALAAWLREHGYEFSDELKGWAEHYIKAKWKITAFKVSKSTAEGSIVASSAVRMSFKTERPFFPYREPASAANSQSSRLLRVFFIGNEGVEGRLDDKLWPGKAAWSNLISVDNHKTVAGMLKLPGLSHPSGWWLTEFEDRSSPRPGSADVYFSRSEDQAPVERPPHIEYTKSNLGGYMMALAVCGFLISVRKMRRSRS